MQIVEAGSASVCEIRGRGRRIAEPGKEISLLERDSREGTRSRGRRTGTKEKARDLCRELLAKERLAALIRDEREADASRDAMRVIDATNIVYPNEKIALREGLKGPGGSSSFAHALYDLLHGSGPQKPRFERFADVLLELGAAKWTIATYYPFFFSPETEIFVKPTVTQSAAQICAYEIGYRSDLDWHVYERIRGFAEYLREGIAALRPRDMIDVQSFMWCISPNRDETRAKKASQKQTAPRPRAAAVGADLGRRPDGGRASKDGWPSG